MSAIGTAPIPSPVRARRTLLSSCAVASAMVVLGHTVPAAADGYNGTITASTNYTGPTTANQGTINLTSTRSILTWTPTDRATTGGSINFQDAGAVTTFVGPGGTRDNSFSVLNRILPVTALPTDTPRGITFNGTTNGLGSILFYSPGGIIISPTARFDVGRLLLSTNDITLSENGYGRQSFDFAGTSGSLATIEVQPGADSSKGLFASGAGANYVALVAPRIIQNGTVSAVQTAYVAAEAGNLTTDVNVNSGLFSFAITTGTAAADALTHGGVTALTNNESTAGRAFMVAVPKNTAITMLVGGSVTYANQVSVEDGAIILSTGGVQTTSDGLIRPTALNAAPGVGAGNITITGTGGSFTSIFAAARSRVTTAGAFTVNGNVDLFGGTEASFGSRTAGTVSVRKINDGTTGGNLTLTSFAAGANGAQTGGLASLFSTGGSAVTIAGDVVVNADGVASSGSVPAAGTGGTATLNVSNAQLDILGSATVTANGRGASGGTGGGGAAAVTVTSGALAIGESGYGGLTVSADGVGGDNAQLGGNGTGGVASIVANGLLSANSGPTIRIGGSTLVSARGSGGLATDAAGTGAAGGVGRGGTASVSVGAVRPLSSLSQGSFVADSGDVMVSAAGIGGGDANGFSNSSGVVRGGDAFGGSASLTLNGGALSVSTVSVDAAGAAGSGSSGYGKAGGAGGAGTAGVATMTIADLTTGTGTVTDPFATTVSALSTGSIAVSANASGGRGGDTYSFGQTNNAGDGGAAIGSRAVLEISTGTTISTGAVTVSAVATGGDGGTVNGSPQTDGGGSLGGAGGSGSAGVESLNAGTTQAPLPAGAYLLIPGSSPNARSGSVSTTTISVLADGTGGAGGISAAGYGAGGDGIGGTAQLVQVGSFASSLSASSRGSIVSARGFGGASGNNGSDPTGVGGDALGGGHGTTAGGARVYFGGGTINLPDLVIDSGAQGGTGNLAGGNAFGGAAGLELVNGATVNSNIALTLNGNATGGGAFNSYTFSDHDAGVGGSATGGAVSLQIYNGSVQTFDNAVSLTANGVGASLNNGSGYFKGGAGTGGSASISVRDNANATFSNGVSATASGTGGDSIYTAGATGIGGSASFTVDSAVATTPTLNLTAVGTGGDGGPPTTSSESAIGERQDGGAGIGGTARLLVQQSGGLQQNNFIVSSATTLDVRGNGGASTGYGSGSVSGAVGGSGTGGGFGTQPGGAFVDIGSGGTASLSDLTLIAEGNGGSSAQGGAGGDGRGGKSAITVGVGDGSTSTLTTSSIVLRSAGFGAVNGSGYGYGYGGAGGAGAGGTATLTIAGGTVTNTNSASLDARGFGADGSDVGDSDGSAGVGGVGTGGTASVSALGGPSGGGTLGTGQLTLMADAGGGNGGRGNYLASGAGGAATGGTASILANGGTGAITLSGNLRVSANATGGDGGTGLDGESGAAGGIGRGGTASVTADNGQIVVADDTSGTITASLGAAGIGGYGGGSSDYSGSTANPVGGAGADAFGGSVAMSATNGGRVTLGNLAFDATASGGYGAPSVLGGNAIGGSATLLIDGNGTIAATDAAANDGGAPVTFDVHARGGDGGGSATGGAVSITSTRGGYSGDTAVDLGAVGTDGVDGHYGTSGAAGGSARAGSFTLDLAGSTVDNLSITALATAGNGGNAVEAGYGGSGGAGGDVFGATISMNAGDSTSINVRSDLLRLGSLVGGNGGNGATGTNGTNGADGIAATAAGATGGAGQKGGAGTSGGAGGRGGNATGAALTLTASLGTLTLDGGNGTTSLDLTARGGSGGTGGTGGDGGTGGTGGAGGPEGSTSTGTPIPAGPRGPNGIQGDAGISGDGGMGGTGTGGALTLATTDETGAVRFGDLSVDVGATGGDSGAGGGPSFGGADRPVSYGVDPLGGSAVGGLVSINTGSADNGPLPAGTITGGALSVVSTSTAGLDIFENSGASTDGRFQLHAASASNAGDTSPDGSIKLDSLAVTIRGGQDPSFNGSDGASVDIAGFGSNIVVANDAAVGTDGSAYIRGAFGGQINIGRLFTVNAGTIQAYGYGSGDATNQVTANAVQYFANYIYSDLPTVATRSGDTAGTIDFSGRFGLYVQNLTATESINLTAGTSFNNTVPTLTAGNIRTTAAVDPTATSLDTAGGGTINIVAGANFNSSLLPNFGLDDANIEINGPIAASNAVRITAGGSVHVDGTSGAVVQSDNLLRIDAGNDVVIDSGAFVRAGLNPLADPAGGTGPQDLNTPAALYITAGVQQQNNPTASNVSVVRIDGTATSGIVTDGVLSANNADRRAIQLTGQAVQTEGGTLAGRSLNVDIVGAPAPNTNSDTDLNLANGCLRGDVCLGAFDLTDRLIVGGLGDDVAALPTLVRIADGADIPTTIIRAQGDITLGTDEGASLFGGNKLLRVQSFDGAVNLLGGTTLRSISGGGSGGVFQVLAEQGIVGSGATLQSDGTIGLYTGSGGLELGSLLASSLTGLDPDLSTTGSSTLTVSGPVTINNLLAVSNDNIDISAGGDLFVNSAAVNDGFNIRLGSTGGNAVLNGTAADTLGQAFDINVSSDTGDATLNNASAERDITVTAAGTAFADQITAGDDIAISGNSATIGSANTTGSYVETGYGSDGSNLSVTAIGNIAVTGTANAFDTLRLTSTGGGQITANTLTAGNDAFVSGGGITITSITSRGTSAEAGYGTTPDGSNITLTASGANNVTPPAILFTTANAAQDLTVSATDAGGTIDATSLTAGRDITLTSAASLGVTSGSAGRDFSATSTQGSVTGGTLSATRDLTLSGNLDASLDDGTAGRDLTLTAGGLASAGTLSAGDDVFVNGDTISLTSATSTGTFGESGYGADGSNVTLTAAGSIDVSGTADAFDTLKITSSGGRVTANTLTAGNDAIVSGNTLAITSVTSRGTSLENGYGVTPDGSNISLTATGADTSEFPALVVTNANAFQDLTVQATDTAGSISSGTLAAGRDATVTASSAASVGNGSAGRDFVLASSDASVSADTLSAGQDLTVSGDTSAALGTGTAGRDLRLSAGTTATSATMLTAGDDIFVDGNAITIGSAKTTGAFAETGYGADGSNVTLTAAGSIDVSGTADAFDTLKITSSGGRVTANQLTAGDDAIVSGNTLSIASVVSRGTSLENGYGATPDGSNIRLTATGGNTSSPALTVTTANAFQDLTVQATDPAGAIGGGTLSAGRNATVTAGGAASVTGGTAGNDYALTSTNGAATGGTLSAARDLTVTGGTTASLASGTAGRDLRLTAGSLATLTAGTAGDDILVNGATVTIGSANTTGAFTETGYGADGSNITVGATGAVAITGTANAFGDLTVTSSGGRVTGNILTAGDDATISGTVLSLTSVTSRGTSPEAGYGATPDGSNILLTASGAGALTLPSILVNTANAAQDLTLRATNATGSIVGTSLTAGRDIAGTAGGTIGITTANAGRDLSLTSTNATLTGTSLTAGRNIAVAALGNVTIGDATANGPVILPSDPANPIPTSGIVSIAAGRTAGTGGYAASDITLTGTVRAAGHVLATAGRDIIVAPTAAIRSDNRITLNAGDDVLIRSGATVSAALAPAPVDGTTFVSPAALVLGAGTVPLGYTPAAGNVASLIVDGTLSSASRPVNLTAGAIQADSSALTAGSLTVDIVGAPAAGAAQSNDGGQLRLGCLQGDVCLGAVTLTGYTAGTATVPGTLTIGQTNRPTNVRVAGAVDVATIDISAADGIYLGSAITPITQTATGSVFLTAGGAVNLLGGLTLAGGSASGTSFGGRTIAIDAGTDVAGGGARIVSGGPLSVNAGGSVTLASTSSGEATRIDATHGDIRIDRLTTSLIENSGDGPGSGVNLTAGGSVSGQGDNAADIDAVGDVYVRAGGDVRLGTAIARNGATASDDDGSDIDIVAGGAVRLASGTASDDAFITAGTDLTIGTLTANGETNNDPADTAGGNIRLAGGTIGADALTATTAIDARAVNFLRVDDARSPGTINFTAAGTDLAPTTEAPDGTLAVELGTVDAGTLLTIGAENGGIRFASLAAPDITLDAGTRIAGGDATARAGSVSATASGDIAFGTVTATDGIAADAGGAFTATSLASAIDSGSSGYREIHVTAGSTIDIGAARADRGNVDLSAAGALNLGSGSAGDSVLLTSSADSVTAGTLVAGTFPAGATNEGYRGAITADAGTFARITSATAPGAIAVTARGGDIALDNANAGQAITLTADAGGIGAQTLVAGDDIGATARDDIAITTATAGGAIDLTSTLGAINGTTFTSGADTMLAAGTDVTFGAIASGADVSVDAGGAITGDTVSAAGPIDLAAGGAVRVTTDIAGGTITATGTDIALNALGDLNLTTIDATDGNVALTSSGGAVTVDRATATGSVLLASGEGVGGTPDAARFVTANTLQAGTDVTVNALGAIGVGTATAGGTLALSGAGAVTLGGGTAGIDTNVNARDAATIGTVTTGRNFALDAGGNTTLADVTAGGFVLANATGTLAAATLRAADDISLSSGGNLSFTSATSTGGDVSANTGGDLSFGSANAAGSVLLAATGALGTIDNGSIMAGASISASTGRDLALNSLSAVDNLTLNAGGTLTVADATAGAGILTLTAGSTLTVSGSGTAGTSAAISAGGAVDLASISAGTTITARSTGSTLDADTLRAGGDIGLTSAGNLTLGDGTSTGGGIALTGAAVRVGTASAAGTFAATATDTIDIAAPLLNAGQGIALNAGGALTANGLHATNSIVANGGGAVRVGDVESVGGTVRSVAGDSLTIGNVRAAGSIFLTAAAAVTAGDLTAGTGPILPGEGATSGGGGSGGTDLAPAGIAPGFDGSTIVRCDDCFTIDPVSLPFLVNYFGNTYTSTYVSNNGYLTFNGGQGAYTPTGLGASYRGQPIIAAFFADVDTRNSLSSQVTYGEGTFAGRQAFGATYANVGYFAAQGDKLNSFQIVLTNRSDTGTGNFDIYYNYTGIKWETGSASGGTNGFGGVSAAVGYNAGTGGQAGTFFELPGSRVPGSFLDSGPAPLITTTNDGTPGQLVFMVRNGAVAPGGSVAERPSIHVTNTAGTTPADITLGNLSAEAAEVHGSGAVTVGNVDVSDRGSGIATTGQAYATVLDAATNLTAGNIMSTGLVTLGARTGDLLGGTITTAGSAVALVGGAVQLGAVTTGTGTGDSLFISDPEVLTGTAFPGFNFGTLLTTTTFDPTVLASATAERTGGALSLGLVTTGNLIAAAGEASTLGAVDATGAIRIDSGGDLTATSLAAGGDITATTDQHLVFASADADGSVTLAAGGTLSTVSNGTIDAGGSISATSGQALTVGDLSAADDLTLRSGGTLTTGALSAGGDIDANAGADLAFRSADAGGGVTLVAAGALSPIDTGTISAGTSISASTGRDLTVGSLIANTDLTLRSGGALTLGSGVARGGTLTLAAAGPLTVTGTATAGNDVAVTAGGAINTGAVTGGDTVSIDSTGGDVTVTDLLATNSVTVRALGNLFVRDAVANAANGNVSLASGFPFAGTGATPPFLLTGNANVSGTVSAGNVTIQGGGDVLIGAAARIRSDGTILIASGDDITAAAGSVIGLGQIVRALPVTQLPDTQLSGTQQQEAIGGPTDTVTISAGSLRRGSANLAANGPSAILLNGTVDGLAIALNSEAVDIGSTGQVGSASTTAAVFTNSGTGGTIVGGAGDTTGYALSNAALGRTRAQAIRVVAPADVVVRQLGLTGSAATAGNLIGGSASFEIATPGSVSVEGAAAITSAAQTDLFAITAGNRITVLTPSGSIALNGTGTALAGRIRLAAPRITVATQPAITALDGLTTLDARDERLASNDGTISDAGFLQANALEFRVSSGLYIQNSGATRVSDTRRGFTAGAGGVTIVTTGTTPAEIAINGRQALTDGTFVTGKTLIDRLTLSGTGQATMASFDPRSTVNGCLIVGLTCRFDGMAPTQPIQDVINQIINGETDIYGAISSVVQQLNSPLIDLVDFTPFRLSGIIDEPVTGAGNDDFYTAFTGDDDAMSSNVTVGEQVTGTGRDQTTDEPVTGTGKDQSGTNEQVTGTGRDQIEKSDGKCDPTKKKTDPDCK